MGKFQDDLKVGQKAEDYFIKLCDQHSFPAQKSPKGCKEYDVQVNGKTKFEIKYDIYSEKSGNIAIEFYNPKTGLPSGVMASKSDYFIYFLGTLDKGYYISIMDLRDLIQTKPIRIIECGGDNNASLMLYRISDVIHLFSPLDDLWTSM